MGKSYDLAIVGAGILGLAHALAATRLGLKVIVIDRDARANGASVRNFGFVTVSGQEEGQAWERAMRSRDVWAEVAPKAGIRVEHEGLTVVARRPEAMTVLEAFMRTAMGEQCELLTAVATRRRLPMTTPNPIAGGLYSPHERRVESREAIPKLTAWLAEALGVRFLWSTSVQHIDVPRIETSAGTIMAETAIVCPGDDFTSLYAERLAPYRLTRCKLHMMRVDPGDPGWRLPSAVMSDLSLVRYHGFAALPEAAALRRRIEAEQPEALANGVHLIVVQSADGSLVVGDSHHYGDTPDPFAPESVDRIIYDDMLATLSLPSPRITERWIGIYASSADRLAIVDRPSDAVRIVIVTSGTGASTGFAIGEETVRDLFGRAA
ncbi:MAG: TIGR03364 family FAD-dependent oxidoreductase [Geminicoccaceae bacterium]